MLRCVDAKAIHQGRSAPTRHPGFASPAQRALLPADQVAGKAPLKAVSNTAALVRISELPHEVFLFVLLDLGHFGPMTISCPLNYTMLINVQVRP